MRILGIPRLRTNDEKEQLRIAIIRGVNNKKPHSYRVSVGSNPNVVLQTQSMRRATFLNRLNTMEPNSNKNLEIFLGSYNTLSGYIFAPVFAHNEVLSEAEVFWDHALHKRELHVREAWEVGKNDIDSPAIHRNDMPIIPDGQNNPPVSELFNPK